MQQPEVRSVTKFLWIALAVCLALRLVSISAYDLLDPTEGRYAAMGQEMHLSSDWVTPKVLINGKLEPFLGKPPLHTWLTAASFKLFGETDFAARFPSLVCMLLISGLIFLLCKELFSVRTALLSALVNWSSVLSFFIAGICLTDPVLVLGTVLAGCGFILCLTASDASRAKRYGYLFFVGMALGMLAKGPVTIAIMGVGILPWLVLEKRFADLKKLPWVGGIAAALLIVLPWYLIAEFYNPGFIKYFIINENLMRFFVKEYGDKYGSGHVKPYGTIWGMAVGAFLPWSIFWIVLLFRKFRSQIACSNGSEWFRLAAWLGIAPMVLFTFARQTTFYYVLPGIPWISICTAVMIDRLITEKSALLLKFSWVMGTAASVIAIGCAIYGAITGTGVWIPTLSVLSVVALVLYSNSLSFRSESINAIAFCFLSFTLCYAIGNFGVSAKLDETRSAKRLVEYLEHTLPGKSRTVSFLEKAPQSAFFYAAVPDQNPLIFSMTIDENPPSSKVGFVVLRDNHADEDDVAQLKGFVALKKFERWLIYQRIVVPG